MYFGKYSFGPAGIWIWNGGGFDNYYADEYAESTGFTAFSWVDLSNPAAAGGPTSPVVGWFAPPVNRAGGMPDMP